MKKARSLAAFGAALCLTFNALAASGLPAAPQSAATLDFYNLHTQERISVPHRPGQNVSRATNWFMRDFRRGETANMDPALFDLLLDLQTAIKQKHPNLRVEFHVLSGYRSPETNNILRNTVGGQAKNSQHMQGTAMDIHVPGLSTIELRDIATCLKAGGVGYYAGDGFVHVDTGRVRYWPSRAYLANLNC
ncbi:MAG: YcbK family protein [Micavibrio sp.]